MIRGVLIVCGLVVGGAVYYSRDQFYRDVPRTDEIICSSELSCNTNSNVQFGMITKSPECENTINMISKKVYTKLEEMTSSWNWHGRPCKRPEEAFRQSLLQQGDPHGLLTFKTKLESCTENSNPVSIAIMGGSVTYGHLCEADIVDGDESSDNDALHLPDNLSLPLSYGNSYCPWANKFYSLLRLSYPRCKNIQLQIKFG